MGVRRAQATRRPWLPATPRCGATCHGGGPAIRTDRVDRVDAWRWLDAIGARPAVARGMAVASDARTEKMDDEARKHLFGQR